MSIAPADRLDPQLRRSTICAAARKFNARREGAAWSALPFANGNLRYDIAPLLERVRVPTSILWGARETQVGVATGRRLAALRPDLPFTLIDNTKAYPELERPTAVIDVIRADI